MKKLLLLAGFALASASAFAVDPQVYEDAYAMGISPDGKYTVSEFMGTVILINNFTGEKTVFEGDEYNGHTLGLGNFISEQNIIVGAENEMPAYLKDGEWKQLHAPYPEFINFANGITPDGTRIVGTVGYAPFSLNDEPVPMQVPCVWDLQSDGTYSEAIVLPYPDRDYTNRVPQYVMGIAISADGKTVVGQMTDNSGMAHTLVYFTLNDENQWECHNEFQALANPNNVEIPADPGDAPEEPNVRDFMTEEEVAAYDAAMDLWAENGYNPEDYPDFHDFMTEEEVTAYDAAVAAYDAAFEAWMTAFDEFNNALMECGTMDIMMNNLLIAADGSTAYGSLISGSDDPFQWWVQNYSPIKFNLADNQYEVYPMSNVLVTSIAADGTLFGRKETEDANTPAAYIYLPDSTEPITLEAYMEIKNPAVYGWMKENMTHSLEVYDAELEDFVFVDDYMITGIPYVTPDMKYVATACQNYWDMENGIYVYSYFLPLADESGVAAFGADEAVEENLPVYNTQGILMGRGKNALNDLPAGIYVIGNKKVVVK